LLWCNGGKLFDQASWINSGGQVSQFNHTPWLQLVQAANYNPDLHVVLGKVHLDAQSKVTALSYGDVGALQRTSVTVPAQSIHSAGQSTAQDQRRIVFLG